MLSRKRASEEGLRARPAGLQSLRVQKVGIMMVFAPAAMSSRNASGKARSQQIRRPTLPIGVVKTSWGACVEEVR